MSLYWLGKHLSESHKEKLRLSSRRGAESPFWKGDKAGLSAKHKDIKRNKPKPAVCEKCTLNPPTLLHNLSGRYNRRPDDWVWWCLSCHQHHHKFIDMSDRKCSICNRVGSTLNRYGRPHWAYWNKKLICRTCYTRLRDKPKSRRGPYKH